MMLLVYLPLGVWAGQAGCKLRRVAARVWASLFNVDQRISFVLEHNWTLLVSILVLHEVLLACFRGSEKFALVSLFVGKDRVIVLSLAILVVVCGRVLLWSNALLTTLLLDTPASLTLFSVQALRTAAISRVLYHIHSVKLDHFILLFFTHLTVSLYTSQVLITIFALELAL